MKRKLYKALRSVKHFGGAHTLAAVLDQMPDDVVRDCPARIIALVGNAINRAYLAGRASCGGAEIMADVECVWVPRHTADGGKLIPLDAIDALIITDAPLPGGRVQRSYSLNFTEVI